MKRQNPKKKTPLIIYYFIALIAILVINFVIVPMATSVSVEEVGYGDFIEMLDNGKISEVEVNQSTGVITFGDTSKPEKYYRTGLMNDYKLTDRLLESGIKNFESPIIEQMSPVLSILLSWIIPFLLIFVVGRILMRSLTANMGGGGMGGGMGMM